VELLCLGAVCAAFFTPLSMRLAKAIGAIDVPDGERKRHAAPMPRLGGLAVFAAIFLVGFFLLPPTALRRVWLSGGALLCVLGVSDDVFSLSAPVKLLAECTIATLPVAFGLVPRVFTLGDWQFVLPLWLANFLTVFWVILLTNAFNLIDGLDGLCVTQTMLASMAVALLFSADAWLLFGAALGFLPYNRPALALPNTPIRTRAFLGDTGALFLGYSLAVLSIGNAGRASFLLPLLFFVPVFDCIFSFLRRIVKGKNPFLADGGHLHHVLYRYTHSSVGTVTLLALLSVAAIAVYVMIERA